MQRYNHYLINECDQVENTFVFIQTKTNNKGKALAYSAVYDIFLRISKKTGFICRPHILRYTHATELIKNAWDYSHVQKRLGHVNIQTTINTYTHLTNDDLKQTFKTYQQSRSK